VEDNKSERTLRLSVLDQSPVPAGSTPAQALQNSIDLARHVDALGYNRFWMSEHHAMDTLACTAPEVMLARIGAETRRIRIGSGGIMLPHYSPLKVAESFRMLHALYPGRVDLGVGRAPGGGPVEALALRQDRTCPPKDDFPQRLSELLAFLDGDFPADHPFRQIRVSPLMPGSPDVWLLGSSMWSAAAAAEYGLPYSFAHFFSAGPTRPAIEEYFRDFIPSAHRAAPEATVAVGVICADTDEEAEYLLSSVRLLQLKIRQGDRSPVASPEDALRELRLYSDGARAIADSQEGEWPRYFVGTAAKVKRQLNAMAETLGIRELVIVTITHSHAARLRSYELLADAFALPSASPESVMVRG
jgi:luciferase family oxidoreductase group 1